MALQVTHTFNCAIADDPTAAAAGEILPSHWNAAHTVSGGTSGSVVFVGVSGQLTEDNAALYWDDTNNVLKIGAGMDVGLGRNAAGVMEINSGTAGTLRDLTLRNIVPTGTIRFGTAGSIPFCGSGGSPVLTENNTKLFWDNTNFCVVLGGAASNTNGGLSLATTYTMQWGLDTGMARNAGGVVEINNATPGTLRDLKLRSLLPAAGTASAAPITFTSGTNLTTATAGVLEYDGKCFYETAVASARQVVDCEQIEIQTATRTFTNNTNAQAIFNATTNGAITLAAATTYEFEMMVAASGFSSSAHTINLSFTGTATYTGITYFYDAQTGSTLAGPTATLSGYVAVATATAVIASSTTTGLVLRVRGTMRINAGGTVIPTLTQVTASAAAVVQIGSFFRCWPIGDNNVTNVGNWS